jgi:hypothetical protein
MLIGKINSLNWYQAEFNPSVELIDSFVLIMETQAEDSIRRYKAEKKTTEVIEDDLGDDYGIHRQNIEVYAGLNNLTWSFEEVFEFYFPSLQRRSALLTVCGFFEHELDKLCVLFQGERKLTLGPNDLRGQGLERSTDYLTKVIGLALDKKSLEWKAVTRVREIRNIIAHRDGRMKDAKGKIFPEYKDALENLRYQTSEGDEIVLEKGFVSQAVVIFKAYFKLIEDSIQGKA